MKNYKKIICCLLAVCIFAPAVTSAGVYFMKPSDGRFTGSNNNDYDPCYRGGYRLNSCSNNRSPADLCPADNNYFKRCVCNTEKYSFDNSNCASPKSLQGQYCETDDGVKKYEKCSCDTGVYSIVSSTCPAPKVKGEECTDDYGITRTKSCNCPGEYKLSCTGANQSSVGQSCDNKYAECSCPSDWAQNCPAGYTRKCSKQKYMNGGLSFSSSNWYECKPCPAGTVLQGGQCVTITCNQALQSLFNENQSDFSGYYVYSGTYNSDANGKTLVVGDDVSGGYWSHLKGTTVISGKEIADNLGDGYSTAEKNVILKCTNIPVITMAEESQSMLSSTSSINKTTIRGMKIVHNETFNNSVDLTFENMTLEIDRFYPNYSYYDAKGKVTLKLNKNDPKINIDNTYIKSAVIAITGEFSSTGYDYKPKDTSGTLLSVKNIGSRPAPVVIKGDSDEDKASIKMYKIDIAGVALIKDANIKINHMSLGYYWKGSSVKTYFNGGGEWTSNSVNPGTLANDATTLRLYNTYIDFDSGIYLGVGSMVRGDSNTCITGNSSSYAQNLYMRQLYRDTGWNQNYYPGSPGPTTTQNGNDHNLAYYLKKYDINSNGAIYERNVEAHADWKGVSNAPLQAKPLGAVCNVDTSLNLKKYECDITKPGGGNCDKISDACRFEKGDNNRSSDFLARDPDITADPSEFLTHSVNCALRKPANTVKPRR